MRNSWTGQLKAREALKDALVGCRSRAAPMGILVQQMVETADTENRNKARAEQPNGLKKTERPRRQLRQIRRSRPKRKRLLGLKRTMVHHASLKLQHQSSGHG